MDAVCGVDGIARAWEAVVACRVYHAYRLVSGAVNPSFRKDLDGRLLDFKAGWAEAIAAQAEEVGGVLRRLKLPLGTLVTIIPGHRAAPSNAGTPLARMAERLASRKPTLTPVVDALVRY